MKNRLLLKLFAFAVIVGLAFTTSCKDYDEDINKLQTELNALKTDVGTQLSALEKKLTDAFNAQIATLTTEINKLKADLAKAATKEELAAVKKEILEKTVSLETFNAFKKTTEDDIAKLKTDVANAATKAELEKVKSDLLVELGKLQKELGDMGLRVTDLEKNYADLLSKHDKDVQDLYAAIADLKGQLEPRIITIEAILKVKDGKSEVIADIYQQLADQLALIEANAKEIADVKKDLADKYAELVKVDEDLQKQITDNYNELDGRVNWNKAEILKLQDRMDAAEADIKKIIDEIIPALEKKLNNRLLSVYLSLDKRVTGLTFIPEYTSPDGTPQIVVRALAEWEEAWKNNTGQGWEPKAEGTAYKGITYLKYNVSPSNATLDDFEVVGLLQKTSEIIYRSTEEPLLLPILEDVTLKNGILTVPVLIHNDLYVWEDQMQPCEAGTIPAYEPYKNVSVALQVKNKNLVADDEQYNDNDDRLVVSSEYLPVRFGLMLGYIAKAPLENETYAEWDELFATSVTYKEIVKLAYNDIYPTITLWNGKSQVGTVADVIDYTINLNDSIVGVFGDVFVGRLETMLGHGFDKHKFVFELVGELNSEGVPQSTLYTHLNGETGVIGVVPNNGQVNMAAVGRTPVVLAKAVVGDKVYAVGYIKIIITDKFDNSDIGPFTFNLGDFNIDCDAVTEMTVADKVIADMDQIFNHHRVMLGKDAFFEEYEVIEWESYWNATGSKHPAGAVWNDVKFEFATYKNTQTGLMENYIKASIFNDTPAGEYKVKTVLKSNGYRPDIVIWWTFKVKLPNITLTPNTVYYKNGGIVVNPTIYEQGALTSTAYEALLNNTFMHQSNSFIYTGLTEECEEYLTPYFVFTRVPVGFTISADGKTVLLGGITAAKIEEDPAGSGAFYIRLQTEGINPPAGPWGNHPPYSNPAKLLVGEYVKVQPRAYINGQTKNVINLFDPFTVRFTYPLTLTFPADAAVYDQANDGVKNTYKLNLYNPTVIKDWNGKLITPLTEEGRDLIAHYEIDFDIDWIPGWILPGTLVYRSPFVLGEPKINVGPTGIPGDTYYSIPQGTDMKIEISEVQGVTYTHPSWGLINVPASITFKWSNSSTGAVQNEFKVRIPVSLKHKWSPNKTPLTGYFYISVKPGNGN